MNRIVCGDCEQVLGESFGDNSFDVCVTDPPYGMGMEQWDHSVPPKEAWAEILRVLKPGAFCLSFCSPMLYHRLAVNMEDAGFVVKDQLIWMVTTKMASANKLKPAHEPIAVCQKPFEGTVQDNFAKWGTGKVNIDGNRVPWEGEPPTGWIKGGHQRRAFGKEVEKAADQDFETEDANPEGRHPSNIVGLFDKADHQKYFYAPRVTRKERGEYNDHPTPKPIDLMRWLISIFTPDKGIVLDPYNGSGSTGIAAIEGGYEFVGIDLDQHYCDIAKQRIADYCSGTLIGLFDD